MLGASAGIRIKTRCLLPISTLAHSLGASASIPVGSYGIPVYLNYLETYLGSCGGVQTGKFTASGVTIGECKLFATLHIIK